MFSGVRRIDATFTGRYPDRMGCLSKRIFAAWSSVSDVQYCLEYQFTLDVKLNFNDVCQLVADP